MYKKISTLVILSGCVACTPVVVKNVDQEPGIYEISAFGNVFTSEETLSEKIKKKAIKVCKSENFHYVGNSTLDLKSQKTYSNVGATTTTAKIMRRRIKCD